jgi:hypothetical protein
VGSMRDRAIFLSVCFSFVGLCACGEPAQRPGEGQGFARASMQGGGGSAMTVSPRSIELVSWLVQFNRLNSPEKLEAALNKKAGELIDFDGDRDGKPDFIAVTVEPKSSRGDKALGLRARAAAKAADGEVHIATLFFDGDWGLLGYESLTSAPPRPSTVAAAASSAALLAAKSGAAPVAAGEPVVLRIRVPASGSLLLDGEALAQDEVLERRAVAKARAASSIAAVIEVEGDGGGPRVSGVVAQLKGAGIDGVTIQEVPAPSGAPAGVMAVPAGSEEAPGLRDR